MANHLERLAFLDETSVKTNMAKTTGWAPCGQRLTDHAPFGHWRTQTFVAALRHDRLDAPWVIDGAMNRRRLQPLHRNPTTADAARRRRRHSRQPVEPQEPRRRSSSTCHRRLKPLHNPIAPISIPSRWPSQNSRHWSRKAAARTYDQLWAAVGHVCDLFSDEECYNYFKAAGYEAD